MYPSKKRDGGPTPAPAPAPTPPPAAKGDAASGSDASTANGSSGGVHDSKRRLLIHVMIETLYEASMYRDAHVQRQVLKALLTTVSSVSCPVHDHSLLQAVTSCYQIYLQAADETNRTTSKAALTQIFNIVFQRMEHFAQQLKQLEQAAKEAQKGKSKEHEEEKQKEKEESETSIPSTSSTPAPTEQKESSEVSNSNTSVMSRSSSVDDSMDLDSEASFPQAVEPTVIESSESDGSAAPTPKASISSSSAPAHPASSTQPSSSSSAAASTSATSSISSADASISIQRPPPGKRGYCVVCSKPANHTCLQTRDPICGMECKLTNLTQKDPNRINALSVKTRITNKLQVLQNDAYYLLRALIKLSSKSLATNPPEAAAVESKLLSLNLLQSVLQNAGPTFTSHRSFIQLIKTDLVSCLLRNSAASSIANHGHEIFALASRIFIALLTHFKPHLHRVIGPMLESIYLPYIQSPNSSFHHKLASLYVIKSICDNAQLCVDIFLNYDAILSGGFNTFQKMGEVLEKMANRRVTKGEETHHARMDEVAMSGSEEAKLQLIALESLVGCMGSLAAWSHRLPKPQSALQEQLDLAMQNADAAATGRTTAVAAIGAAAAAAAMTKGAESKENGETNGNESTPRRSPSSSSADDAQPSPSPSPSASPPVALSTGAHLASSFSQQFALLRAQKQKLDSGISKFNHKPSVGLAYLQSHALLGTEPRDIAAFFHSHPSLDKTQMGNYMGEEHDFNKKVLYAYVEQMNFSGLTFDEAIRQFVQGFRLPGEAQKIDRMMEKFAEQYHKNNPGRFQSADTAYVLAYSIILLNTDAHSPMVKRRMTKEDFFKNCRGIDDGKDIDPAFLGEIYDRITQNEIKMKDDELKPGVSAPSSASSSSKARFSAFVKESQQMVRRTQELIKREAAAKLGGKMSSGEKRYMDEIAYREQNDQSDHATATNGEGSDASAGDGSADGKRDSDRNSLTGEKSFYEARDEDAEAIRPMFELLCFPSLATFSLLLEENDAESIVHLCLQGYRYAIRVANALDVQTARLAFVSSLKKFTFLGSDTKAMRKKNIEAIATLLAIASTPTDANHLKDSWFDILQCISEVERLHLIANNVNNSLKGRDNLNAMAGSATAISASSALQQPSASSMVVSSLASVLPTGVVSTGMPTRKEMEAHNSMQVNLIDSSAIDRVFASSAHLDGEAIVDFVNALRQVSEQELASVDAPRVFSLQKMVEITYYNMSRIRVVWSRIWSLLSSYFQKASCHPHLSVSMYAIDSLRQLAMRFLDIDELASYQFQRHFFAPFEYVMKHNPSMEIRELVLQCMMRMVTSRGENIRSGWKGVFTVLSLAAIFPSPTPRTEPRHVTTVTPPTHPPRARSVSSAPPVNLFQLSFDLLCTIMDRYSHHLTETGVETMDACVNCLVAFGSSQTSTDASIKAIKYLITCAASINKERKTPAHTAAPSQQSNDTGSHGSDRQADEQQAPKQHSRSSSLAVPPISPSSTSSTSPLTLTKIWFLILTGLSRMVGDARPAVRSLALTTLFSILHSHGHAFTSLTWRHVFHGALFPIFDDVRYANESRSSAFYMAATHDRDSERMQDVESPTNLWPANATNTDNIANADSNGAVTSTRPSSPNRKQATTNVTPSTPTTKQRTLTAHAPHGATSATPPPASSRGRHASMSASVAAPTPPLVDQQWLQSTCFTALSSLVDLYARFQRSVHFLLPDVLRLLHSCICQSHSDELARIGVRCLVGLLLKIGRELSVADWWSILRSMEQMIQHAIPQILISDKLRQTLGSPALAPNAYRFLTPFIHTANQHAAASISQPQPSKPPHDSAFTDANTLSNVTASNLPGPQSSSRSAPLATAPSSSSSSPSSSTSVSPLPFAPSVILTRLKVLLWLIEATFQLVMNFFPQRKLVQQQEKSDGEGAEKGNGKEEKTEAETQSGEPQTSVTSDNAAAPPMSNTLKEVKLFDPSDERILHCFTPSQALFAVDLLGLTINFAHAFNADIALRRKLHSAGFHLPAPHHHSAHSPSPSPSPVPSTPLSGATTTPPKPARLPQLFYHEAHALRLVTDILFRLLLDTPHCHTQTDEDMNDERHDDMWWKETHVDLYQGSAKKNENQNDKQAPASTSAPVPSTDSSPQSILRLSEHRLISLCLTLVRDYVMKTQQGQLVSLEQFDEPLVGLINNFASLPPSLFQHYLPHFYIAFAQLIEYAQAQTIRRAISRLFTHNIAQLLPVHIKGMEKVQPTDAIISNKQQDQPHAPTSLPPSQAPRHDQSQQATSIENQPQRQPQPPQ